MAQDLIESRQDLWKPIEKRDKAVRKIEREKKRWWITEKAKRAQKAAETGDK